MDIDPNGKRDTALLGVLKTILLFLESLQLRSTCNILQAECAQMGYPELHRSQPHILVLRPSETFNSTPTTNTNNNNNNHTTRGGKPLPFRRKTVDKGAVKHRPASGDDLIYGPESSAGDMPYVHHTHHDIKGRGQERNDREGTRSMAINSSERDMNVKEMLSRAESVMKELILRGKYGEGLERRSISVFFADTQEDSPNSSHQYYNRPPQQHFHHDNYSERPLCSCCSCREYAAAALAASTAESTSGEHNRRTASSTGPSDGGTINNSGGICKTTSRNDHNYCTTPLVNVCSNVSSGYPPPALRTPCPTICTPNLPAGKLSEEHIKLLAIASNLTHALQLQVRGQSNRIDELLATCRRLCPEFFAPCKSTCASQPEPLKCDAPLAYCNPTVTTCQLLIEDVRSVNDDDRGSEDDRMSNQSGNEKSAISLVSLESDHKFEIRRKVKSSACMLKAMDIRNQNRKAASESSFTSTGNYGTGKSSSVTSTSPPLNPPTFPSISIPVLYPRPSKVDITPNPDVNITIPPISNSTSTSFLNMSNKHTLNSHMSSADTDFKRNRENVISSNKINTFEIRKVNNPKLTKSMIPISNLLEKKIETPVFNPYNTENRLNHSPISFHDFNLTRTNSAISKSASASTITKIVSAISISRLHRAVSNEEVSNSIPNDSHISKNSDGFISTPSSPILYRNPKKSASQSYINPSSTEQLSSLISMRSATSKELNGDVSNVDKPISISSNSETNIAQISISNISTVFSNSNRSKKTVTYSSILNNITDEVPICIAPINNYSKKVDKPNSKPSNVPISFSSSPLSKTANIYSPKPVQDLPISNSTPLKARVIYSPISKTYYFRQTSNSQSPSRGRLLSTSPISIFSPRGPVQHSPISTPPPPYIYNRDTCLPPIPNKFSTAFTALYYVYDWNPVFVIPSWVIVRQNDGLGGKSLRFLNSKPKLKPLLIPNFSELDFKKIKRHLLTKSAGRKLILLQALRWRLTKTDDDYRDHTLNSYIRNDLLGLNTADATAFMTKFLGDNVSEKPEVMQETMARLVNAFASLTLGRDYLSFDDKVVMDLFIPLLLNQHPSGVTVNQKTREFLIATLQKLSLRAKIRKIIVSKGIVQYILDYLSTNLNEINSYCLEYATALLMNLCLQPEAQQICSSRPTQVVQLMKDLLKSKYECCLLYANGIMYSLLKDRNINQEADNMKLADDLNAAMQHYDDNTELKRQFEVILALHMQGADPELEYACANAEPDEELDIVESEIDMDDSIDGGGDILNKYRIQLDGQPEKIKLTALCNPTTPRSARSAMRPNSADSSRSGNTRTTKDAQEEREKLIIESNENRNNPGPGYTLPQGQQKEQTTNIGSNTNKKRYNQNVLSPAQDQHANKQGDNTSLVIGGERERNQSVTRSNGGNQNVLSPAQDQQANKQGDNTSLVIGGERERNQSVTRSNGGNQNVLSPAQDQHANKQGDNTSFVIGGERERNQSVTRSNGGNQNVHSPAQDQQANKQGDNTSFVIGGERERNQSVTRSNGGNQPPQDSNSPELGDFYKSQSSPQRINSSNINTSTTPSKLSTGSDWSRSTNNQSTTSKTKDTVSVQSKKSDQRRNDNQGSTATTTSNVVKDFMNRVVADIPAKDLVRPASAPPSFRATDKGSQKMHDSKLSKASNRDGRGTILAVDEGIVYEQINGRSPYSKRDSICIEMGRATDAQLSKVHAALDRGLSLEVAMETAEIMSIRSDNSSQSSTMTVCCGHELMPAENVCHHDCITMKELREANLPEIGCRNETDCTSIQSKNKSNSTRTHKIVQKPKPRADSQDSRNYSGGPVNYGANYPDPLDKCRNTQLPKCERKCEVARKRFCARANQQCPVKVAERPAWCCSIRPPTSLGGKIPSVTRPVPPLLQGCYIPDGRELAYATRCTTEALRNYTCDCYQEIRNFLTCHNTCRYLPNQNHNNCGITNELYGLKRCCRDRSQ